MDTIADPDSMRLRPDMLVRGGASTDSLRKLVQNVLEYQKSAIVHAAGEADPYSSFESDSGGSRATAGPDGVIPPYFFIYWEQLPDAVGPLLAPCLASRRRARPSRTAVKIT